jgi:hypothetical protein
VTSLSDVVIIRSFFTGTKKTETDRDRHREKQRAYKWICENDFTWEREGEREREREQRETVIVTFFSAPFPPFPLAIFHLFLTMDLADVNVTHSTHSVETL